MNRRRTLVATLAALALVAGLGLGLRLHRGRSAGAPLPVGAPADLDDTGRERLAAVERVVAERNRDLGKTAQGFKDAGWVMTTSSPPPDERLLALDPSLIAAGREKEVRYQLASAVPPASAAHNIAQIVLLAQDPVTRESAADALGRIRTTEAKDELIGLLTGGKLDPKDLGRRQLASLIQPVDLEDEIAAKMGGLLDHEALTPAEKKQVAFTLALVGLRDGMALPDRVTSTMSPEARALVAQMTQLATSRRLIAHGHEPAHE